MSYSVVLKHQAEEGQKELDLSWARILPQRTKGGAQKFPVSILGGGKNLLKRCPDEVTIWSSHPIMLLVCSAFLGINDWYGERWVRTGLRYRPPISRHQGLSPFFPPLPLRSGNKVLRHKPIRRPHRTRVPIPFIWLTVSGGPGEC